MTLEITFLGTGTSQGVPVIGCDCAVCRSEDPRDRRMRTSVLVGIGGRNILIDATPELRLQCLANDVRRIDACLVTHTHADHILGMDDLRRFNQIQKGPIDIYAAHQHRVSLEKIFGYARADRAAHNHDLPQFIFREFEPGAVLELFGAEVQTLPLPHGEGLAIGYRLGNFAYCTDLSFMPEEQLTRLEGLDILVLGALRPRPHPRHLSFDQAIELARRIGARQTYFVHMSHQVRHGEQDDFLPAEMRLAYDGLKLKE